MTSDNSKSKSDAPSLSQIEGARQALINFTLYHYQALIHSGYTDSDAKAIVAKEIISLYDQYVDVTKINFRPQILVNPKDLFSEILKDAKALGIQGQGIYRKLIDFQRLWDNQEKGK